MTVCSGTKRDGTPCTLPAARGSDYCYLHDPDPAVAQRRSRNASRAATLGNSRIGAEIRSTRLMVRELLELTLSNELHLQVRKRLTEVVQLLQVYCRLVELELTAGEKPALGDVSLPEDTKERITEWAADEEAKVRERKELVEELSQAMKDHGHDPTPIREMMGG
jgi:type III secretion system FlhB-like substrate exporter